MQHIVFTQAGYEALQKEQSQLLAKRPDAVAELKRAREMGDLSENGFYKGARLKLSAIDRRLRELKHLLRYGKIVSAQQTGVVSVGSAVVIHDGENKRTYYIVGEFEANPLDGKISHHSPIGKALIGKKEGETVTVIIPSGVITYTIVSIG